VHTLKSSRRVVSEFSALFAGYLLFLKISPDSFRFPYGWFIGLPLFCLRVIHSLICKDLYIFLKPTYLEFVCTLHCMCLYLYSTVSAPVRRCDCMVLLLPWRVKCHGNQPTMVRPILAPAHNFVINPQIAPITGFLFRPT
jgi:hypothetical protein